MKAVSKFYAHFEPIVWGVLLSRRKKRQVGTGGSPLVKANTGKYVPGNLARGYFR